MQRAMEEHIKNRTKTHRNGTSDGTCMKKHSFSDYIVVIIGITRSLIPEPQTKKKVHL
jgi:hypothetical protein